MGRSCGFAGKMENRPRRSRAGSAAPFPCAGDRPSAASDLQGVEANVSLTVNFQGGIIFYHEDGQHR